MPLPIVCIPIPIPVSSQTAVGKDKPPSPTDTKFTQRWVVIGVAIVVICLTAWWARGNMVVHHFVPHPDSEERGSGVGEVTKTDFASGGQSLAECRKLNMFVDPSRLDHRKQTQKTKPKISIIYITKRPGGYDFLLHSLAQQTINSHESYELICVDELAPFRSSMVTSMADELNVNLVAILPSKPKNPAHAFTKFGIYNAINTGILHARGEIVTFLMDLAWLPENYIARTLEFYAMPQHKKSFLAYPEAFYHLKKEFLPDPKAFDNERSVTFFSTNRSTPLKPDLGKMFTQGYKRPKDIVQDADNGKVHGYEKQPRLDSPQGKDTFWELSFASCPFKVLEELNGVEEEYDVGDDCHEVNIRLRSEFLGYDLWVDGQTVVQNLWHKNHFQPEGDLWNRHAHNSIQNLVIIQEMSEIGRNKRETRSRYNNFNLTRWRQLDCPINM